MKRVLLGVFAVLYLIGAALAFALGSIPTEYIIYGVTEPAPWELPFTP